MTTQFLIGTSGWTYDDWKGTFYPQGLAKARWFSHYATQFTTVEVNATFYRSFADTTYEKWYKQAPEDFCYVLKAPRLITHRKFLVEAESDIQTFWRSAALLKDKLGLVLLQVAPQTRYDPDLLRRAILAFEEPRLVAVEFRNKEWLNEEIGSLLRECGATFVSVDSPKERPLEWLTSSTGYIRLHGRKKWYLYDYTKEELGEIASVAWRMSEQGAKTVYIFFNNDYQANAPRNAHMLMELLGSEGKLR